MSCHSITSIMVVHAMVTQYAHSDTATLHLMSHCEIKVKLKLSSVIFLKSLMNAFYLIVCLELN